HCAPSPTADPDGVGRRQAATSKRTRDCRASRSRHQRRAMIMAMLIAQQRRAMIVASQQPDNQRDERAAMELYTAGTGNGQRAAIAVNECSVPCTIYVLNLAQGDQRKPDYLKINPTARIPTLID